MGAGAYINKYEEIQGFRLFTDGTDVFQISDEFVSLGAPYARVQVDFASIEAVAVASAIQFHIQGSFQDTEEDWITIATALATATATANATTLNGAVTAGGSTVVLGAGTGFTANTYGFIYESAAIATSELFHIGSINTATVTMIGTLQNSHGNSTPTYSKAERLSSSVIDLSGVQRLRVIAKPQASGPDFVWRAAIGYSKAQL